MNREEWLERFAEACGSCEPSKLTTEQIASLAVQLEMLNGTYGQPKRPVLTLITTGGAR